MEFTSRRITEKFRMSFTFILLFSMQLHCCCSQDQRDASDITCAPNKKVTGKMKQCCDEFCCDKCPPGFYVLESCKKNVSSICWKCNPGSFSSGKFGSIRCTNCGQCENTDSSYFKNCTEFSDTVCPCPYGQYVTTHLKCEDCAHCKPGYGVWKSCTHLKNTQCRECPKGYFSNSSSYEECRKCSTCRKGTKVIKECSPTEDSVCRPVKETPTISTALFIMVVVPLSAIIIVLAIIMCMLLLASKKKRRAQPSEPLLVTDSASEAQCRGSSVSTLDQEKRVMKYIQGLEAQSFSTRSSLCSDRPRLVNVALRLEKVEGSLIQRIGFLLNPRSQYSDWESLGGLLGYTHMEIKNFRLTEGSRFTEAMLHDFCTKKPKLATLGYLLDKVIELEREDVVDAILEYDKKICSDRTETPV